MMRVSAPFTYVVGFESAVDPEGALRAVSEAEPGWTLSQRQIQREQLDQYQFTDADADVALTPNQLNELIQQVDEIRYIVPVYRSDDLGLASFTPVPNHVVVIVDREGDDGYEEFDELLQRSGFDPIPEQRIDRADQFRMVYSWSPDGHDPSDTRFLGEPGMSLALVDAAPLMLVAELDWFVTDPNYLETDATRPDIPIVAPDDPPKPIADMVGSGPVRVAVLDGEFDLEYPGGNLPFNVGGMNVVDASKGVGVIRGHAHGTLCAGVIGARKSTPGYLKGGLAPDVQMVPFSIYAITEPIVATSSAMVKGIDAAVAAGCGVISLSVALPSSSDLQFTVEWADSVGTVIVAGTGNLEATESGSPSFVLYPARYSIVLGVGAAIYSPDDEPTFLQRVTLADSASEPLAWESRYGKGIDVVAKGLDVISTDIHGEAGAVDGDIYEEFSGTSAATPLVAAFAARIAANPNLTTPEVRAIVRNAAVPVPPYGYDSDPSRAGWDQEVGFGLITRSVADDWYNGYTPSIAGTAGVRGVGDDPEIGADMSGNRMEKRPRDNYARDLEDPLVDCGPDITIKSVVKKLQCPYGGLFRDSLRPLGDFLQSLGSTDDCCCRMAAHFWRDPYRTARVAGLPWHAAILLGQGDWEAIYKAVDAENHRNRQATGGPIWVRVR